MARARASLLCTIADCGRARIARGLCFRHYQQARTAEALPEPPVRLNLYRDTEGACAARPGPCPEIRCRYHLGNERFAPDGMAEPCAIRLATAGPMTLAEVGAVMGLTRERVRQIEVDALRRLRGTVAAKLGLEDHRRRRTKVPPRVPPAERWTA